MSSDLLLQKLRALFEAVPTASRADTAAFKSITHDQYLERLKHWLALHRAWLGELPRVTSLHGGDEEGCDVVAAFEQSGARVCFQFKSSNDLYDYPQGKEADFANKVMSQLLKAASTYRASEIYLIFGAVLTDKAEAHEAKISAVKKLLEKTAATFEKEVVVRLLEPQQALTLYQQPNTLIDTSKLERLLGRNIDVFWRELGPVGELWKSDSALRHIESLYVPPMQFEEIKSILQERHLLCIVGEPHMGKTFTALYLLLAYYRDGYKPRWEMRIPQDDIWGERPLPERYRQSGYIDSHEIGMFVRPGQVVYIEDPFGKTSEEELRFAASGTRFDLGRLLEAVRDRAAKSEGKPPKVIITSRRAIFQRAVELQPELEGRIVEVRRDTFYDVEKRRDILRKYIEFFEPKWAGDNATASQVIEQVPDELLAPHNIYLFVNRSKDQMDLEAVQQEVEKAKKIVPALIADIKLLQPLSQLVFVTTYVASFEPSFQRFPSLHPPFWRCYDHYQAFAEALEYGATEAEDSFRSTVVSWNGVLEAIGIEAIGTNSQQFAAAQFRHPSFVEATAQFIVQSDHSGIFSRLCLKVRDLYSNTETRSSATKLIHPLIANFEHLPPRVLDQVKSLFRNGEEHIRVTIVEALLANYDRLAPPLREFLDELDPNKDKEIWYLFMQAAFPNPRLSFAQTLELWNRALGYETVHGPRLWPPAFHPMHAPILFYRQLPTGLQQIILNHLESRDQFRWYCLASPLIKHYEHVPCRLQRWIKTLAFEGNEYVIHEIMNELGVSYERLPVEIQSLIEDFGTAPNWKCRAYVVQKFWDQLDRLQPAHAELVWRLALQDPDGRVRISVVYTHLMLAPIYQISNLPAPDLQIFDKLFYSENPEDQAGVLFSLFSTLKDWTYAKGKEKYEKRFAELVASEKPLVVAMLRYRVPREDCPPGLCERPSIPIPDSEIDQHKDTVNALADGLESVAWGPRGK